MMVCTQCGFQNETQDAFCGSCGAFLEWAGEKVDSESAPEPEPDRLPVGEQPAEAPAGAAASAPEATAEETAPNATVVDLRAGTESQGDEEATETVAAPTARVAGEAAVGADVSTRGSAVVTGPPSAPPPGPVARRPDALRSAGPKTRPVPAKPPPRREVRPGDLVCNQCEEGNDPERRFCRRCGASLVEAKAAVAPPPLPWWKRLFVRQPKVLAAGERPMRRGGTAAQRTLRSRLSQGRRLVVLLAVVGLGLGYLGPWRSTVNTKVGNSFRGIREMVAPRFNEISPDSVEGTTSALPDHPPEDAVDDIKQTYWAEGAEGDGIGQRFVVNFDPPVNLGKIGFRLGASTKPEDFATQPRPERVRLHFFGPASSVSTKDLSLKNTADFQQHDAKAKDTVRLEIEILSTNPSLEGGTATSIAEIEFWERK